jgi:hypothetical protein
MLTIKIIQPARFHPEDRYDKTTSDGVKCHRLGVITVSGVAPPKSDPAMV